MVLIPCEGKSTHLKLGDRCVSCSCSLKCYDLIHTIFVFLNFRFLTCNTNTPFQVISDFLCTSDFIEIQISVFSCKMWSSGHIGPGFPQGGLPLVLDHPSPFLLPPTPRLAQPDSESTSILTLGCLTHVTCWSLKHLSLGPLQASESRLPFS